MSWQTICASDTSDFLYYAADKQIHRYSLATKIADPQPIDINPSSVTGFDFDSVNNCVFWSERWRYEVYRKCSNVATEVLYKQNGTNFWSIAYDWTSELLYLIDDSSSQIRAIGTSERTADFNRVIVDYREESAAEFAMPIDIAVHPKRGYLFWISRLPRNMRVKRADLDGSNQRLLRDILSQATTFLAIDYELDRIFLADVDGVLSMDLDGKHVQRHDLGIEAATVAIYGDKMLWVSNSEHALMATRFKRLDIATNTTIIVDANPTTERLVENLADDAQVISKVQISIKNACNDAEKRNNCSFVCIPIPNDGYKCY